MAHRFLSRLLISSGAVAACLGAIGYTLARPVPDEIDTPLASPSLGWPPYPLELTSESLRPDSSSRVLRASLSWAGDTGWPGPPEVRLLVATFRTRPRLVGGVLAAPGGECTYETPDGTALEDNQYVTFRRRTGCRPDGGPPVRSLDLTVTIEGEGRLGLWTYLSPAGSERRDLLLVAGGPAGPGEAVPVVRGRSVAIGDGAAVRRIDLLNYMWNLAPNPAWIWWLLGLAGVLAAVGSATVPADAAPTADAGFVTRAAAGICAIGAALGLVYAVLVPPLHGPDEPDHLLSYARLVHEESLPASIAELARRGHLQRIRFRHSERFRPADLDAPYPAAWDAEVFAEAVEARSATATAAWRFIHQFAAGMSAPAALLTIRLSNVLLFTMCLGAGTAILVLIVSVPLPQVTTAIFLLVPALPFFAMHVSETAFLASAYVVLACCLLALVLDGPRSAAVGLPLGLAVGLVVAGGRSAIPLTAAVAAVLAGRVLFRDRAGESPAAVVRAAIRFWGGWVAGVSVFAVVSTRPYRASLARLAAPVMPPDAVVPAAAFALAVLTLLAVLLEIGLNRAPKRRGAEARRTTRRLVRWSAVLLAILVAASLAGSLVVDYPHLGLMEVDRGRTAAQYVREATIAMATALRLRSPELMLWSSFWAGFGWLDTVPPDWFVALVSLLTGTSLIALLVTLAVRADTRLTLRYACAGAGLAVSFAFYAGSAYLVHYNLVGRYLLGFYLVFLILAGSAFALVPSIPRVPGALGRLASHLSRPGVVFVLCGALHTYAVWFILQRYF